ncbi:MAG: Uma2 family endonuclease [Cyanobacteria bacterium P01_C01_bin.120]
MTISTKAKVWTDDEFMALPNDGRHYELVNGEVCDMGNAGMEHREIGADLAGLLAIYVRQNNWEQFATLAPRSR